LSNIFDKVLWLYQRSYTTRGAKSETSIGGPGALPDWPLVFPAGICLVTCRGQLRIQSCNLPNLLYEKENLAKFESEVICDALLLDGHHALADHKQTDTST
jgi:hypothetical protein